MKHRNIAAFLLSVVLLIGLLAGCGAQSRLVGTWETSAQASVLGEGVETPTTVSGTVRFIFREDGSGAMETDFGSVVPAASDAFDYTVDGKELTLNLASRVETFAFKVKRDTLVLDGSHMDWELTRQS